MTLALKRWLKKALPQNIFRKIKIFYRQNIIKKREAVFYLSFKCNYHCPYCVINRSAYYDLFPRDKVKNSWQAWVEVFKKLPPLIIGLSGGEPFLNEDLVELVNNISTKHVINITTNLSLPIDDFIKRVQRRPQITASFHSYEADLNLFKDRVLQLKKAGFPIMINFVGYPQRIHLIPQLKKLFEDKKIMFNVDPYIDPSYKYSSEEIDIIKKYSSNFRSLGFEGPGLKKKCFAGSSHFIILPNGDAYACQSGLHYNCSPLYKNFQVKRSFYLGNLFLDNFKFYTEPVFCDLPCSEACDIESAFVRKIK